MLYNLAKLPSETCIKFEKNGNEKKVDATYLRKIAGSSRYLGT